jgi:DNA segregation ATPase FtsK/SpoIIIE, S-DNA-T family
MAAKRKAKNNSNNVSTGENYFTISTAKKKKILGIFLIVLSILIFLSIISYSSTDKYFLNFRYSDFSRAFSPDQNYNEQVAHIDNWLNIFGAYTSYFFIDYLTGVFSVAFPFMFFIWGFSLFHKIRLRTLVHITNFLLLSALILSSFFGILRTSYNVFVGTAELSGNVGDFFGEIFARLFGGIGGIIFLVAAFLALLIFAFDIKIEKIFTLIKAFLSFLSGSGKEKPVNVNINQDDSNLIKIKRLGDEVPAKKKRKFLKKDAAKEATAEELMLAEAEEQTKIRIIRKDEEPATKDKDEDNPVLKDQVKKVDLKETGEIPLHNVDKDKEKNLPEPWEEKIDFKKLTLDLLDQAQAEDFKVAEEELTRNAELLKEKLKLFDIEIQDISVTPGPVVTLYEIVPAPGVKISKIVGLENDIALALAARGIRIIAPIPGKSAIGVEIPNAEASLVNARSVLSKVLDSKYELPMAFGKTINGDVYITDLARMPHLLIAGSTGSGKSVGINMIISSLLYTKHPSEVKLIIIDPKKIELSFYNKLRKHYLAVSPDLDEDIITNPQNSILVLKSVENEMEKRYDKLAKAGVRNIVDYNKKVNDPKRRPHDTEEIKHHPIPYLIVIVDELADLMITAGKEVEEPITRLAQLARAVGIHLVLATQRPSVNVITGVIKANFSARIAYQVASKVDSRTILDMNGAEQLLGKGDMLFLPTGSPKPIRIQNAFISTDEVEKITNYIYSQQGYSRPYYLPSIYEKKKSSFGSGLSDLDPMFEDAARVIVRHQQGSVSLLQRRLKLGYSRAARIVDQLEEAGIVGPNDGSKARTVIVENEEQLETILRSL